MLSDKVHFNFSSDLEDNNFKSCFARSIVVNSQYQNELEAKRQLQNKRLHVSRGESFVTKNPTLFIPDTARKIRDYFGTEDLYMGDSRRSSACSSRIAEMPIENLVLKSQIETLQWQLKQTESSKEMYREVMEQVVKFLERAYRSLQILGSKVSSSSQTVSRTQSDYLMNQTCDSTVDARRSTISAIDTHYDYTSFRDFTWRRQKKMYNPGEEISPEKLSQEAFRLLRTAQSLLNTRAPDLAQVNNDATEDLRFLEQLAKEFPRAQESTQRADSRCSSVPLSIREKDIRISTAFNRKLVLQQNAEKRNSLNTEMLSSLHLSDDLNRPNKNRKFKLEIDKSSPPMSSVSSAEDESGFSSMNSFQEIGIPLMHSSLAEEEPANEETRNTSTKTKEFKLWHTPELKSSMNHKRWNSTPADDSLSEKPLKVLWV